MLTKQQISESRRIWTIKQIPNEIKLFEIAVAKVKKSPSPNSYFQYDLPEFEHRSIIVEAIIEHCRTNNIKCSFAPNTGLLQFAFQQEQ